MEALLVLKLAVVCRDFWPDAGAIGDGLLMLAQKHAHDASCEVFTMSRKNLTNEIGGVSKSGNLPTFRVLKPLTTSRAGILARSCELVIFSLWVLWRLLMSRPAMVYVSTNPPLLVPFVAALYCRLLGKKFVYHVQDIHPEAADLVLKLPSWVVRFLMSVDNFTLKNADSIITLTPDMVATLQQRIVDLPKIEIVDNPALVVDRSEGVDEYSIIFCGNAGRLQVMDELLPAIDKYLSEGGKLKFTFVGGGVHFRELERLAGRHPSFEYRGIMSPIESAELTERHNWALLPINPTVLKFAYPSKLGSYLSAGCKIICVTAEGTSLAKNITKRGLGLTVAPNNVAIKSAFFEVEKMGLQERSMSAISTIDDFSNQLLEIITKKEITYANS